VFASGACALVYQVAWMRDFRLIFGASTPASAAVVAIFVGGLGLGAWRLGTRAERTPWPLRLYARLELGIAASAAASPLLVGLATRAYVALGGTVALGMVGATIARLSLATLVLALPTLLMGGTLPALARVALAGRLDPSRRDVGLLYGVNTLGAVVGCVGANFVLLEQLGTHGALWLAASVNAGLALTAGWMARSAPAVDAVDAVDVSEAGRPALAPAAFVLAAAAVVGFAFFLMELVFYRMLVPLLGGTIYTFGLVLAVALLGIGIGGALYAALFARREARASTFAATCLLEAASLALPYALGDRIALLAIYVRPRDPRGLGAFIAGWFLVTAVVVLPASIAAGVQFPTLVALLGRGRVGVARHVGLAYAWNTLGAIAGAIAGGFVLMPLLTAPGCWRLATGILGATGLAAAALAWQSTRRRGALLGHAALAAVVAALVLATTGPTAAWRHSPIGAGRVDESTVASSEAALSFVRDTRRGVEWEADGVESSVALHRNGGYAFTVNAKSDGHCRSDAGTQVMGGLLGAMLHPAPASAMVIGLGTGSTAGWLASVPSIERVDVVELEPAMVEVARRCAPVNEHAIDNPKLHVVPGDAREVLSVTRARYDVVFSEPSNPYRAGVASLYTQEYYRRVRDHLAEGGLFLQWVQGYEIDRTTMRTVFATMASVFPHVEAWQMEEPDLVLVASQAPVAKDAGALRARIAAEPFARALRVAWGVDDLEGVLAHFVARGSLAASIAADAATERNTDDRPVVEFGFARTLNRKAEGSDAASVPAVRQWARERGEADADVTGGEVDWGLVELERAELPCAYDDDPPYDAPAGASDDVRERVDFERKWTAFDAKAALAAWDVRPRERPTPIEQRYLAESAVLASDPRAHDWLERLAATRPLESLALQSALLEDEKRYAEAADTVERALVGYRTDPWPSRAVMWRAVRVATLLAIDDPSLAPRMRDLLSEPFAIEMLRDQRLWAALSASRNVDGSQGCASVLAPLEPDTPWDEWMLRNRRDCYRDTHDPRTRLAEQELSSFLAKDWAPFLL
jgi:hypothetical protein